MKLILCTSCSDVFKLSAQPRSCACGKCSGQYTDNLNAEVSVGDQGYVLGFANSTLVQALRSQREHGDLTEKMGGIYGDEVKGREFTAFIIPNSAPTVRRIPDNPDRSL